jgi:DNA-binding MarR family transcriptional regulator
VNSAAAQARPHCAAGNQDATGPRMASARTSPSEERARETGFEIPVTISRAAFLRDGTDAAFRETIYTMVRALDGLMRCREVFARHLGLTGSQFAVLMGVAYRQGETGVTIRDLAEHVRLAPTHVTTEVGRLIRRRLLVKRRNAADGRSVLVSLSPAGENAVRDVSPVLRQINDTLFRDIGPADFDATGDVLRRLADNADQALAQPRAAQSAAHLQDGLE